MIQIMRMPIPMIVTMAIVVGGCSNSSSNSGSGAPTAPSELKVVELEGGGHLTWKDNSDNESGFMIERKVGTGTYATLTTLPFNTTQYHDPNLTSGTSYTYHVMAMGKEAGKDSDFSNEVTFVLGGGATDGGMDASHGGDH